MDIDNFFVNFFWILYIYFVICPNDDWNVFIIFSNLKLGFKTSNMNRFELDGSIGKQYKVTPKVTNSLSLVYKKNCKKIVQAMIEDKNKINACYKILMELEHKKIDKSLEMQKSALQ